MHALSVENLTFRYAASGWELEVPALTLAKGEQLLMVSPSGAGKSTLLNVVAGLLDPTSGSVRVADQNFHALRGAARDAFRGRHVGMIFQTFNLLQGFTAAENVMAALLFAGVPEREHRAKAQAVLQRLGITRIDAPVEDMSVGQQQRVAVARAMVCDPVLVLADEPTASLDPTNARAAMDLIQEVCREKHAALLCVSHDPAMASRFERRESLTTEHTENTERTQ
ncbi:MAG TPA: ABC transporter ATP-binding protein [Phycisphaerales bacterium]|nr:ABC transporter ATP-binding protein [Phycisphaerales bacterium]